MSCPQCQDGVVWIRTGLDDELPAPCPECDGRGNVCELAVQVAATGAPALYAQQDSSDPTVYAVLEHPLMTWRWYVSELDPGGTEAFGFVAGMANEWGYFDLGELDELGVQLFSTPKVSLSSLTRRAA